MTAPLFLVVFAIVASLAARPLQARTSWLQRSPQWGVWAWQALSLSIASAILLAGVTFALPALPVRTEVASVFGTTSIRVAEHYTTPAGVTLAIGSAVLTVALLTRIIVLIGVHLRRAARQRSSQLASLDVVGVRHPEGFVVLASETALVYCLPGRRRTVVVTSTALRLLDPRQLRLVLAHERTHLRVRHDLALAVSAALARAFVGLRVFTTAHRQIETLVEMQADDSARASADRRALARALVTLCAGGSPSSALAAGDTAALARVRRLTGPSSGPLRPRQSAVVAVVTAVVLSTPVALAFAPAIEATISNCWAATHRA